MIADSKSILAKLLASENIQVEHKKVSTAYFDTKNRVMVIPIWKSMTPFLYDLLLGHEVGHALFTPPEGWHDQVLDGSKKGFKTYLNVVEDARIEKCIQEKFPGLKVSFKKGYAELMQKDFFGIEKNEWDINTLPLIDRINLHYKVGSYLNVQFKDDEQYFLKRIDGIKTWDDVVSVSNELYEYGKTEPKLQNFDDVDYVEDMDDDFDSEDDTWEEVESDSDSDKKSRKTKNRRGSDIGEFDPESVTDKFFRQMENQLVDDSVKPYLYVNMPEVDISKVIVPYKTIQKFYTKFRYQDYTLNVDTLDALAITQSEKAKEHLYKKFLESNKKYIGYLVKEFELKKNAKQYARASIAKTGKLDMKKIHSYKTNDDLFKRMTIVPDGKSHGLLMFVDYSGSMGESIQATIEQTLVLVMFCRKVNIPFRVYAFTDLQNDSINIELGIETPNTEDPATYFRARSVNGLGRFSKRVNDLHVDDVAFRLREYVSSEMNSNDFKDAVKYWLLVGELMTSRYNHRGSRIPEVSEFLRNSEFEQLNGTPLNEAIISAIDITEAFRKQYKLDVVNTVFLTDGDSNDTGAVYKENDKYLNYYDKYGNNCNVIIRHTKTMLEGKKIPNAELTTGLLDLLKKVSGANTIGFFIACRFGRNVVMNRISKTGKYVHNFDQQYKKAKQQKFFMLNDVGYDDFYIIPGGKDLEITEDNLVVSAGAKKAEIKNAFMKMQKSKSINRVLLSRFVSKIA
jgi:hypothetical protein